MKPRFTLPAALALAVMSSYANAAVTLENEVKVADNALYFNGVQRSAKEDRLGNDKSATGQYDYAYGRSISPHGDAIKVYKDYVFMTWYRGGKLDRHMMLTRYNKKTGAQVTIEFPHQHTGFEGRWWHGETHNTIAVAISPKDETIHLLFDMHAYHQGTDSGGNGSFAKDYFRYSYSVPGAASVADEEFTLAKFVKDTSSHSEGADDYNHLTMTGVEDHSAFSRLTYPSFFLNQQGDLLMHMRQGTSYDGSIVFNKYDPEQKKWGAFNRFNVLGAGDKGEVKNWSIYGVMKYKGGKIRLGFQRRINLPDIYQYQNGVYYAYSDDPTGATGWKNYKGEAITMPLVKAEETLVFEPGDNYPNAGRDEISISGGFDWTVTDKGDVHIISQVTDKGNGHKQTSTHSYQKGGKGEFIHEDFPVAGATEIYSAGNDIYVIGLEDGKPYVQQAEGGTNTFTKIYEAPEDSKTFEKGVPYIYGGKLYYYLLENHAGDNPDARKTYLQIIDLDIKATGPEGYTFAAKQGETVQVLGVKDIAYGAEGQFNYLYGQTGNVECSDEVFGAVETPSDNMCYVKVSDVAVQPEVRFESATLELTEGYKNAHVFVAASTKTNGRTVNVRLYLNDKLVAAGNSAPYLWDQSSAPDLVGLPVGSHTIKAIVTDDHGMTAETTATMTVAPKPVVEPGEDDNVDSGKSSGGGSSTPWTLLILGLLAFPRVLKRQTTVS